MKIFLTGNKGYVGSVLTTRLLEENFEVTGCDIGYYPRNFSLEDPPKIKQLDKDIREIRKEDLSGHDAVFHLAALSNDPLGEINSSVTEEINYEASVNLAQMSKEVGIKKFVYSSSCSSYGVNEDIVNEESPLTPLTSYAKTKVSSEKEILKLQDENFSPVILRSATAYGVSPNLRLDLVVNNLTAAAITTGEVKILSDGTAWRPLVHVEDMSNAFIKVISTSTEKVHGQIFNVGSNKDNFTVKQVAKLVQDIVPNSEIKYAENASKDQRSYKVNFDKIEDIGYKTTWNLKDAIKNLYENFKKRNFTKADFLSNRFYRVKYIKSLLEKEQIDSNLRKKESITLH